ncbi:Cullin-1 [Tyrophagus putrescentiae]|nr:Cullin-1 [Tyrophagus putrescentiae]
MEASLDLDDLWIDLRSGFEQIFSGQTVSKQRFMQLYSSVYNYCKFVDIDEAALGSMSVAHFVGAQLYSRVDLFLNKQVKTVRDDSDTVGMEDILLFYSTKWTIFTGNSRHLNQICSFLNKHWIRREVDEERLQVRDVYELALSKWRKVVFEALSANVTTAALNLIEKSRTGAEVDLSPVKVALESFVVLGTTLRPFHEPNLKLYREAFEASYLEDTKNYFISQSQSILDSEKDFVELLTIAEDQLDIERRRARLYLHESTTKQLQSVGEMVLLRGHEKFRTRSFDG